MSDTARTSGRSWWLLAMLAITILVVAFVWTRPSQSSMWEATAIVGSETFEINRARLPRTAAALVRGSSAEFDKNVRVSPIEGTGLISVMASEATEELAESSLSRLLPIVIHDLNRAGPEIGTFIQLTDIATRRPNAARGRVDTLLFGFVAIASLSLSVNRFRAIQAIDGTAPKDRMP